MRILKVLPLIFVIALMPAACEREPGIKHPNTITVASSADAKRLLPPLASDSASGEIVGLVFNGLTKYDKDIKIVGELAESWDISDGGLKIVFNLRKGVKWHDGEEFTAQDVLFTYNTFTDPEVPTAYGSIFGPVRSVRTLGKYAVEVIYEEPYAPALESWGTGMMPKHILDGVDISLEKYTRNPVGTGPFKFKQWVTGQKIVLEAFDDYFQGRPKIDRYVFRIIPDTATRFLELKFGGVDYMGLTPPQFKLQTEKVQFKKYFQKFRYPAFGYTYMGYNLKDPRFADVRVRRALGHAINKDDIVKGVLLGFGQPCTGPFPPESWAFNPDVPDPEYDPEKARALLAEAGWTPGKGDLLYKDGKPFKFTIITNSGNNQRLLAAQIIQENLKAVGIEVDIKPVEWQAFLHEFINKRRFEAIILGWGLSRDPDLYDIWHSSKTKEREFNFISYSNAEVDELLLKGRSTFDTAERKRIYYRIHEILAQEQPYTFLYVADALPVLHKRFKGVRKAPLGIWYDLIHWDVPEDKTRWYK